MSLARFSLSFIIEAYLQKYSCFLLRRALRRWLWQVGRSQWERRASSWIADTWHITDCSRWLAWCFIRVNITGTVELGSLPHNMAIITTVIQFCAKNMTLPERFNQLAMSVGGPRDSQLLKSVCLLNKPVYVLTPTKECKWLNGNGRYWHRAYSIWHRHRRKTRWCHLWEETYTVDCEETYTAR